MTGSRAAIAALAVVFFAAAPTANGQAPQQALRGLDAAEIALLDSGRPVVRTVRDPKKLALAAPGAEADQLRSRIASLRPNYATEVVATAPAADAAEASAILERLARALSDVDGYIGIRYYSTRQKTDYDLFDKMEVRARVPLLGGETIYVLQHMEPFDDFECRYEYRLLDANGSPAAPGKAAALAFSGLNLGSIIYSYRNFKAVTMGNMTWTLYAFRDGGRVVFYGIGGVKAFDMLGIFRDRLEASFMGRVTAFFTAMSERLRGGGPDPTAAR